MPARPLEYAAAETLRDGTPVTIRHVRPGDGPRIVRAFAALERESVYTRFFSYKNALSDRDVEWMRSVDGVRNALLVATIGGGGDEIVIGGASYASVSSPDGVPTAEIAFTVEEDYQGRGLAGTLLRHLTGIARENGIDRFVADVLPQNKAMQAVFERAGLPVERLLEDGVVHVAISLAGAG